MREMKDSGLTWVKYIPVKWKTPKLRYICAMKSGDNLTSLQIEEDGKYPVFGGNGLRGYYHEYTHDGEYVLVGRQGALCGNVHYVRSKFWATDHAIVTLAFDSVLPRYLYYLLNAMNLNQYSVTAAQPGLAVEKVLAIKTCLPPMSEQIGIIRILDNETKRADIVKIEIINEIEKLEEFKQSIISEAVTKGLNRQVEMRESGIKWVSLLPAHWAIIPSKYLFRDSDVRKQAGDVQLTASQKYGIISQEEYMERENAKVVLANQGLDDWKHVEPYDFVISLRSFQGGLEMSETTGCITWHYVVLKATKPIYPKFYKWLFKSSMYITAIQRTCNFIRDGQDLRYSNFSQVPLYEPPLEEQKEIADYLDKKCAEIDAVIATKQMQLETLDAYKKSLIFEYVTGKKEVPSVGPKDK